MKSGFYHPETLQEFGCWNDIEAALGAERGLALIEHSNTIDLFFVGLSWLSSKEKPRWLSRYESYWAVLPRWLTTDGHAFQWVYAGRIRAPMHAAP